MKQCLQILGSFRGVFNVAALALCLMAGRAAMANSMTVSWINISDTNPCPGETVDLTIVLTNNNGYATAGNIYAALEATSTHPNCSAFDTTLEKDMWWVVEKNTVPTTPDDPNTVWNSGTPPWPNNGGWVTPTQLGIGQSITYTFKMEIPPYGQHGAQYGTQYQVHVGAASSYENNSGADSYLCFPFTTCIPSSSASSVVKQVDGVATNNKPMLIMLNYNFFNTNSNYVRDTLPTCMHLISASAQPYDGSPASVSGQTITWRVPDATTAAQHYAAIGSVYIYVNLSGCPASVANTGQYQSSGGAWNNTNTITQQVGGPNLIVTKYQQDLTGLSIASAANGQQFQYVLQYTLTGTQLQCFDSFDQYAVGSYSTSPGILSGWTDGSQKTGNTWNIIDGGGGNHFLEYANSPAGYNNLLYNCPSATFDGTNFCGGMVVADVRHNQPSDVNADAVLVLRADGATNNGNMYGILITGDNNPGSDAGHIRIQKCNPGCSWISTGLSDFRPAYDGIWYTVKALEVPGQPGHILAKFWERGTPEPTGWQINYTDPSPIPCTSANGPYRPGVGGQSAIDDYDNFRVYSSTSLQNASLYDNIPLGVDYVSSNPTASIIPSNNNSPSDKVEWDFFNNNFGAVNGLLYEGTGNFTWVAVAKCSEATTVNNTATISSQVPSLTQNSNTTTLNISCGTPSDTPSSTPSYTSTYTATPTPSPTATKTSTPTYTATPTQTYTSTATPTDTPSFTSTNTPTRTPTPTPSITYTATPTFTPSSTSTPTFTVTNTRTVTPTATPTFFASPTNTPTITLTDTPSLTSTPTYTVTFTRTVTVTDTPSLTSTSTSTITFTPTFTSTRTITLTATPTFFASPTSTYTVTPTYTATPSATSTFTVTDTRTVTPTATPTFFASPTDTPSVTPTYTATPTATPTYTATPTFTPSVTFSPTATSTDTPSATPSFTDTDTPSATPTATPTYTDSPQNTFTATPTATPSFTASPTATPSATPSATVTASATATPSATKTATWTATPSITQTPSYTNSPTITLTPVPMPYFITVTIYNSAGEVVNNLYSGSAQNSPNSINLQPIQGGYSMLFQGVLQNNQSSLSWYQTNNAGQAVTPGTYYFKLEVRDGFGKVTSMTKEVNVVATASTQFISIYNSAGELVRQLPIYGISAGAFGLSQSTYSPVYDPMSGQPNNLLSITLIDSGGNTTPASLLWDGKNQSGLPVASGQYTLQLVSVQGSSSSTSVQTSQVMVLASGQGGPATTAIVAPNPAIGINSVVISYSAPQGGGLGTVNVYNAVGELVATGVDSSRAGKLNLDISNLASGIYMIELRIVSGQAILKRQLFKLAVAK